MTLWRSLYKNPEGLGLENFQVGEHMEIGEGGVSLPGTLPYVSLPLAADLYPLSYPLINRLMSVSLSSVSHFGKLKELKEKVTETSDL